MANGATLLKVVYVDTGDEASILITIGDSIRAQDWARGEYQDDITLQEQRAGMYACFLGAKRGNLPHTDGDWLAWLDVVTMPDVDVEEGDEQEPGEAEGPQSAV